MVNLLKVDHVKFYVKDLEKTEEWYMDKLGFKRLRLVDLGGGQRYVELSNGKVGIDLEVPKGVEKLNHISGHDLGYTHVGFTVANVQEAYEDLVRKGVEFRAKPRYNDVNGRTLAFFQDPEGNTLHLTD